MKKARYRIIAIRKVKRCEPCALCLCVEDTQHAQTFSIRATTLVNNSELLGRFSVDDIELMMKLALEESLFI